MWRWAQRTTSKRSTSANTHLRFHRPEIELILSCATTRVEGARMSRITELARRELDWPYLADAAARHHVFPLVVHNLKAVCPGLFLEPGFAGLWQQFLGISARNLALTEELLAIMEQFALSRLLVIPYKGPVLAVLAYGSLALRQFSDLDILAHPRDFEPAREILVSRGYCKVGNQEVGDQEHECQFVHQDTDVRIDLHRDVVGPELPCAVVNDEFWDHVGLFALEGRSVRSASVEDHLLIVTAHGARHCWPYLGQLCDVSQVVSARDDLDWRELMQVANARGCHRMLLLGLRLAHEALGTRVPSEVSEVIREDRTLQRLASKVLRRLFSEPGNELSRAEKRVFHMLASGRHDCELWCYWRVHRLRLRRAVVPNERDRAVIRLPRLLSFLYFAVRPLRLCLTYGRRWLLALLRRHVT